MCVQATQPPVIINKMAQGISKIYLEEKDKRILKNRTCENCGKQLKRLKTEGWVNWINRQCCSNKCRLTHAKKYGLRRYHNEYKVYNCVGCEDRESYVITIPKSIAERFKLVGKRYEIKKVDDKVIIYNKEGDGRYRARVITKIKNKKYYALTIPIKYIRKYNLKGAIFKCDVDDDKVIAYTKLE